MMEEPMKKNKLIVIAMALVLILAMTACSTSKAPDASALVGTWQFQFKQDSAELGLDGFETPLVIEMVYTLGEDSTWSITVDWDKTSKALAEFTESLSTYTVDLMYAQFAEQNLDKDQANEAMKAQYGQTIEEYVDSMLAESLDPGTLAKSTPEESGTYTVDGNVLHMEYASSSTKENISFKLDGDTLTLESSDAADQSLYPLVLTRSGK